MNSTSRVLFVFVLFVFFLLALLTRNFNKFHAKIYIKILVTGAESSFEHGICVPLENMQEIMGRVTLRLPEFAYI